MGNAGTSNDDCPKNWIASGTGSASLAPLRGIAGERDPRNKKLNCWYGEDEMSERTRYAQETRAAFDMSACMAMMEKIMAQGGDGCDCTEMMSQVRAMEGIPEEWMKVMVQMMEFCCGGLGDEVTA
jgi:hypothetical protein